MLECCMQGSKRSSRGSADVDAQRVGQAEQHYLRGHALRKQVRICRALGMILHCPLPLFCEAQVLRASLWGLCGGVAKMPAA